MVKTEKKLPWSLLWCAACERVSYENMHVSMYVCARALFDTSFSVWASLT
jgi:hypothetical protein